LCSSVAVEFTEHCDQEQKRSEFSRSRGACRKWSTKVTLTWLPMPRTTYQRPITAAIQEIGQRLGMRNRVRNRQIGKPGHTSPKHRLTLAQKKEDLFTHPKR
jgi:hypothetical protein